MLELKLSDDGASARKGKRKRKRSAKGVLTVRVVHRRAAFFAQRFSAVGVPDMSPNGTSRTRTHTCWAFNLSGFVDDWLVLTDTLRAKREVIEIHDSDEDEDEKGAEKVQRAHSHIGGRMCRFPKDPVAISGCSLYLLRLWENYLLRLWRRASHSTNVPVMAFSTKTSQKTQSQQKKAPSSPKLLSPKQPSSKLKPPSPKPKPPSPLCPKPLSPKPKPLCSTHFPPKKPKTKTKKKSSHEKSKTKKKSSLEKPKTTNPSLEKSNTNKPSLKNNWTKPYFPLVRFRCWRTRHLWTIARMPTAMART